MFAGLISKEQSVSAWGDPDQIMAALAPYSLDKPRDVWVTERLLLLQVATRTGSTTAEIYCHTESGVAVAFWGRLDNRSDLIAQLDSGQKASDDELIALAWLKWGQHSPEKLIGDFAFAVASPRTRTVFLARDVMGVKPLYYRLDGNGLFFSNTAAAFKPLCLGGLTRSREWMARFLVDLSWSHTHTAYEEVKKLPGAHCMLVHADGTVHVRRYHRFIDDAPVEHGRNNEWLDAYKSIWQDAIACRLPENGPVGFENSGGLDSGSITSEAARQLGDGIQRLHGMGYCYEKLEPEHIMATAMMWRIKHNSLFSHRGGDELEDVVKWEHRINGYPQEHSNGTSHFPFYQLCRQNSISTLFSGFGGDEGVTNPAVIPVRLELYDQKHWRAMWQILPGTLPLKAARFAKNIYRGAGKMPHYNMAFLKSWQQRWPFHILRSAVVERYDLEREYFASATYDERFRKINDAAIYLLSRPFASTRLDNCSLMAASYGVDYAWPLLDQRLIQQWLSTPVTWKIGDNGISRYLHRMAVDKTTPDLVAWKPNKDMGFGAIQKNDMPPSSQHLFTKLQCLIECLHPELEDMVDVMKAKAMIEKGIKEDLRIWEMNTAVTSYVNALGKLTSWLRNE